MADEIHASITMKMLVKWHGIRRGSYHVQKVVKHDGSPDWAVCNLVNAVLYVNNTQEEAQVICGLCNLMNDADWGTLQRYVDELLPGKRVIPDGVN